MIDLPCREPINGSSLTCDEDLRGNLNRSTSGGVVVGSNAGRPTEKQARS